MHILLFWKGRQRSPVLPAGALEDRAAHPANSSHEPHCGEAMSSAELSLLPWRGARQSMLRQSMRGLDLAWAADGLDLTGWRSQLCGRWHVRALRSAGSRT